MTVTFPRDVLTNITHLHGVLVENVGALLAAKTIINIIGHS